MKWSLFIRTNTLWSASKIKLFPWTLYHFIEAIVERSPLSRSEQLRDLNAFVGPKGPDLHPFLFGIDIKGGTGHLLLYFRNRLDGGRGGTELCDIGENLREEKYSARNGWYDPSCWLSGSIAFYRVRAWIGRGAGREHVPSAILYLRTWRGTRESFSE